MKASKLLKLIQSQIDLYGDGEIEVSSFTNKSMPHTTIHAVQSNIYGTIEIVIK